MKNLVNSTLVAGALLVSMNVLAAPAETYADQLNRIKLGRVATTAPEAANAAMPADTWFETLFSLKLGRPSPLAEDQVNRERENTAYREEFVPHRVEAANTWYTDFYKAKMGRPAPSSEAGH